MIQSALKTMLEMCELHMFDESLCVAKSLYPSQVVIKTAYTFIDSCYMHIEETKDEWIIYFQKKKENCIDELACEIENELISQATRYFISKRTHAVRELLIARAMASSVIINDEIAIGEDEEDEVSEEELNDILTNWFDRNE